MADLKISQLTDGGGLQAGDELAISRSSVSYRATPIGVPVLIYRYTVTGSDKASIDTGTDAADAGSNDWTNGDLLEIYLYSRTDEAVVASVIDLKINNDSGAHYDAEIVRGTGTTASAGNAAAQTSWQAISLGSSALASAFATLRAVVPNYTGTVGNKTIEVITSAPDSSVSARIDVVTIGFRSTAAITRLSVTPDTAAKKLKVGTQLLIYKRLSS